MKNPSLIMALIFMVAGTVISLSSVEAQSVTVPFTFSGISPVALQMDSYGSLSSLGTYGSTITFGISGAGSRMFWFPGQAAFRAGYVDGTDWNSSNLGSFSAAFGYDTIASGQASFAVGFNSVASGSQSVSLGYANSSTGGGGSLAAGEVNLASGQAAFAQGAYSYATAYCSVALNQSTSTGQFSLAAVGGNAYGTRSLCLGSSSAVGNETVAIGNNNIVNSTYAIALGNNLAPGSYGSAAFGAYNVGGGNATTWVPTDPLIEIGNGTSSTAPSDAVIVYKNGSAKFAGPVIVPQSGDIPMYTGN